MPDIIFILVGTKSKQIEEVSNIIYAVKLITDQYLMSGIIVLM